MDIFRKILFWLQSCFHCKTSEDDNKLQTLFDLVRRHGRVVDVQILVNQGVDINTQDDDGQTPLLIAGHRGYKDLVELLIECGANVHHRDRLNKCTLLHYASLHGWKEVVQHLLKKKLDVNLQNRYGRTPLLTAAHYRHKGIVDLLLGFGADVECCDEYKWTLLHEAASQGWMDVVECLVEKEVDVNSKNSHGETPLLIAVERSHKDIARLLVSVGAHVNSRYKTLMQYARLEEWKENLLEYLLNKEVDINAVDSEGMTPLLSAAYYKHRGLVDLLITLGADTNCRNAKKRTLLHYAVWGDIVQSLVDNGADINVVDAEGMTPLLYAADCGRKDMVDLFINLGADTNCRDAKGRTMLHLAKWHDVVQSLVDQGADINAADVEGMTPLLQFAFDIRQDMVDLLITLGADTSCCDAKGRTLLHWASFWGWINLVQLLVEKGADINVKDLYENTPFHFVLRAAYESGIYEWRGYCDKSSFSYRLPLCDSMEIVPICASVRLFIEMGAYVDSFGFDGLLRHPALKHYVLKDIKLCSQAIINKFNKDLLILYEVYVNTLPSINKMKIEKNSRAALEVEQAVTNEIQIKGYCDLSQTRPMVLSILSVKCFVDYYNHTVQTLKINQ